jgi:predicted ABC-type exoprotein transport system permease subunit
VGNIVALSSKLEYLKRKKRKERLILDQILKYFKRGKNVKWKKHRLRWYMRAGGCSNVLMRKHRASNGNCTEST